MQAREPTGDKFDSLGGSHRDFLVLHYPPLRPVRCRLEAQAAQPRLVEQPVAEHHAFGELFLLRRNIREDAPCLAAPTSTRIDELTTRGTSVAHRGLATPLVNIRRLMQHRVNGLEDVPDCYMALRSSHAAGVNVDRPVAEFLDHDSQLAAWRLACGLRKVRWRKEDVPVPSLTNTLDRKPEVELEEVW